MEHHRNPLLQQLFDLINCGVILVDREFTILHANRKAEEMLKAAPAALCGLGLSSLFMPEDRSILFANIVSLTMKRGEFEGEVMLNRLDMTSFIALLTTSKIPEAAPGEAEAIISIHDISRLKSLERTLRESERMAFLGNMLDDISHQIRNPILSIGGFARRLASSQATPSKYIEVILAECGHLERLLNTLQEFIHLPKPVMRRVSLEHILNEVAPMLRAKAREYGVSFLLEGDPSLERTGILLDTKLISRAILAIFENACEAFDGIDRLAEVRASVAPGENWPESCRIVVSDNGCGIGKHILPHVFDPFFSTKTGHVGMGLTFAQRICQEQGIRLEIKSQLGKGTTVELAFPHDRRRRVRTEIMDPAHLDDVDQ